MPTVALLVSPEGRRTANRLLEVLQRERTADHSSATDASVSERGGGDIRLALIERAKGALMHHYGIDSHQAFAVLIGWARESRTPVVTIAQTLLRGICEGNPQTEVRQRVLVRWLELQMRNSDPGHGTLRTAGG